MKIKYCPFCGSDNLRGSKWFNTGNMIYKNCNNCGEGFGVEPHEENPEKEEQEKKK